VWRFASRVPSLRTIVLVITIFPSGEDVGAVDFATIYWT
jgi:hypothetical protein